VPSWVKRERLITRQSTRHCRSNFSLRLQHDQVYSSGIYTCRRCWLLSRRGLLFYPNCPSFWRSRNFGQPVRWLCEEGRYRRDHRSQDFQSWSGHHVLCHLRRLCACFLLRRCFSKSFDQRRSIPKHKLRLFIWLVQINQDRVEAGDVITVFLSILIGSFSMGAWRMSFPHLESVPLAEMSCVTSSYVGTRTSRYVDRFETKQTYFADLLSFSDARQRSAKHEEELPSFSLLSRNLQKSTAVTTMASSLNPAKAESPSRMSASTTLRDRTSRFSRA